MERLPQKIKLRTKKLSDMIVDVNKETLGVLQNIDRNLCDIKDSMSSIANSLKEIASKLK